MSRRSRQRTPAWREADLVDDEQLPASIDGAHQRERRAEATGNKTEPDGWSVRFLGLSRRRTADYDHVARTDNR